MELRNDPLSKKKPENLSEIEALLEDTTKQVSSK
jgi:hypothetical protein